MMRKYIKLIVITVSIITVSSFVSIKVFAQNFLDVPENHIHAKNIERLSEYNIINGYGNGYFGVDDPILREQAITLIYKILKDEIPIFRSYIPFNDVKKSDPNYEVIRWAYETGIIDGTEDGSFNSKDFVTREQMAKILVNAFKLKPRGNYIIADVASNHWSYPYINTLRGNNLTNLYQNQFFPHLQTKRGEMASFLVRSVDFAKIELKRYVETVVVKQPTYTAPEIGQFYDSGWDMKWQVVEAGDTLHLKGYSNGVLVGEYVKGVGKSLEQIKIGMSKAEVDKLTAGKVPQTISYKDGNYPNEATDEKLTFETTTRYVTVFFNLHNNNKVTGILAIDKEKYQAKPFYYPATKELQESYEDLMVVLINHSRVESGLIALINSNDKWNYIARNHSQDMINRKYFAHDSPEGVMSWERISKAGINFQTVTENIAKGSETIIHTHEGLMNSIGHRFNILNRNTTHAIVGVEFTSSHEPYITVKMYK